MACGGLVTFPSGQTSDEERCKSHTALRKANDTKEFLFKLRDKAPFLNF